MKFNLIKWWEYQDEVNKVLIPLLIITLVFCIVFFILGSK